MQRTLRAEILRKLHAGDLGIYKIKAKVRHLMLLPGISQDIKEMIGHAKSAMFTLAPNQRNNFDETTSAFSLKKGGSRHVPKRRQNVSFRL